MGRTALKALSQLANALGRADRAGSYINFSKPGEQLPSLSSDTHSNVIDTYYNVGMAGTASPEKWEMKGPGPCHSCFQKLCGKTKFCPMMVLELMSLQKIARISQGAIKVHELNIFHGYINHRRFSLKWSTGTSHKPDTCDTQASMQTKHMHIYICKQKIARQGPMYKQYNNSNSSTK